MSAFKRLSVENHFNVLTKQSVLVAWVLEPSFASPGPYLFTLQRGHAVNDDAWTDVATTIDQPWLYDNHPVFSQHDRTTYYRVVLTDGDEQTHVSQPVSALSDWAHHDWCLAREILRKESLLLHRKAGTRGYLLKRRTWGDPCPRCLDPSTGAVKDAGCPVCYGTGVVGGYYPPLEYWVLMNPTQRMKKLNADAGLITSVIETVRGLAWPSPEGNDVWVQAGPNKRFRIAGDVEAIARHRGIDLILNLRMEELPQSSVVYTVPTP
jgi:hypothetical protein